jgi:hypothetical protein
MDDAGWVQKEAGASGYTKNYENLNISQRNDMCLR